MSRRLIKRREQVDTQAVEIRFLKGFPRQAYIGALFRAIRDIERGALKDFEIEQDTGVSR